MWPWSTYAKPAERARSALATETRPLITPAWILTGLFTEGLDRPETIAGSHEKAIPSLRPFGLRPRDVI